jgi:hypothetical protein
MLILKPAQEMSYYVKSLRVPRFENLRWAPLSYRGMLPLSIMLQHQCFVVGATHSELTVVFADVPSKPVIDILARLSGRHIYPVLAKPNRVRLLIRRIEQYEREKHRLGRPYYLHRPLLHSIVEYTAPRHDM